MKELCIGNSFFFDVKFGVFIRSDRNKKEEPSEENNLNSSNYPPNPLKDFCIKRNSSFNVWNYLKIS